MYEYANKLKYERAKAESNVTGEPIEVIYVRLGGKLVGDVQVSVPRETEEPTVEATFDITPEGDIVHKSIRTLKKAVKKAAKKK